MISFETRWAMLDGMEKPRPIEPDSSDDPELAIATLMPISSPLLLTRAPPELPWLIAASVWITAIEIESDVCCWPLPGRSNWNGPCWPFSGFCSGGASSPDESGSADDAIWILRFNALTMPVVTEFDSPSGAPSATAVSPTLSSDESANSMGVRSFASVSLMTARS